MTYYETLDKYTRISNEFFRELEKPFKKNEECEVVYLSNKKDEVSVKSKILNFLNIDGSEYMDTVDGVRIRLDKIVSFNGEDVKYLNHY